MKISKSHFSMVKLCIVSMNPMNSSTFALLLFSILMSLRSATPLGCIPITILNGVFPILWFTILFYANSAWGRTISQFPTLSPTKHLKKLPKIFFATSIYPSVCGWYFELKFTPFFIFFHSVLQKYPINLVSLSKTILFYNLCNLIISSKNKLATCTTSLFFLQGIKYVILEN